MFIFLLILKTFMIDVKFAAGKSMEPRIADGNVLIIWKLAYGLKLPWQNDYACRWAEPMPEDIVVFPIDNRFVIKTCVANGGDSLEFYSKKSTFTDYYLKIADTVIDLKAEEFRNLGGTSGVKSVPQNVILALGENLAVSVDSRDFGFVSYDSIYGKVLWK